MPNQLRLQEERCPHLTLAQTHWPYKFPSPPLFPQLPSILMIPHIMRHSASLCCLWDIQMYWSNKDWGQGLKNKQVWFTAASLPTAKERQNRKVIKNTDIKLKLKHHSYHIKWSLAIFFLLVLPPSVSEVISTTSHTAHFAHITKFKTFLFYLFIYLFVVWKKFSLYFKKPR